MCGQSFVAWLQDYEPLAVWLEGIALVLILVADLREYRKQGEERKKQDAEREEQALDRAKQALDRAQQHRDTAEQMDIWRKQIHADRVAGIFETVRNFRHSIHKAISLGMFGPTKWFEQSAVLAESYSALREAHYLSYLVNDRLPVYLMDRIAEAVALQRVQDHGEFNRKLTAFYESWDGDKMAKAFRELS
jgi:hypothetical protein